MESLLAQAAKITCTACAVATDFVHVTSFSPFAVVPADLLEKTFAAVRIDDDARLAVFQKAVAELSPNGASPDVLGTAVTPTAKIGDYVKFLQAVLAKVELSAQLGGTQ